MAKRKSTNKYLLIVICIFILGTIAILLWPSLLNKSYYSTDKNQAHSKLEKLLSNITPSAQLLYTNVQDNGCGSNGVGLTAYTSCSLIAEKYFKANENASQVITQLDSLLRQQGYTSSTYSNDYHAQKTLAVPKGLQEGSAPYKSTDSTEHLRLYVEFFDRGDSFTENYLIEKLVKDKKLPQPSDDDWYFGIQLQKTYWECNSTSLFELYCPPPPSEPK